VPRGGDDISKLKNYIADFGNFKQGFLIMKLVQSNNFRVQDMFSTIVLRNIKTKHGLKKALLNPYTIWPSYLLAYMQPYLMKNLQYNFPKMRGGGGSNAIWNFSKNSSDLVAPPFP